MQSSVVKTSGDTWDAHKQIIARLYIDERKPLNEVMAIMERDYLFWGNKRMYKARLNRWGLKKNLSAEELPEILHHIRMAPQGHSAAIVIRGRPVPPSRINRYLRRSAPISLKVNQNTPAKYVSHGRLLAPRLLQLPNDLRLSDEVIQLSRQFIVGCCEGGSWCPDGTNPMFVASKELISWFNEINCTQCLIDRGSFRQAFRFLDVAFDQLKGFLRDPHPTLFIFVYYNLLRLPDCISQRMCAYIAEMSTILLPTNHPMNLVWSKLSRAGSRNLRDQAWTMLECYFDFLDRQFGHSQYGLLNFSRVFYRLAYRLKFLDLETVNGKLLDIIKGLERLDGCTTGVLHTKIALADNLKRCTKYNTARNLLGEVEVTIHHMEKTKGLLRQDDEGSIHKMVRIIQMIYFKIHKAAGEVEEAVEMGRKLLLSCMCKHETTHARTTDAVADVQSYFAEIGKLDEANRLLHVLDSGEQLQEELQLYLREIELIREDDYDCSKS